MRALLAEDNLACQELLKSIVEEGGWEVAVAETGRQAIDHMEAGKYDILLLDLNLPDMDGFEVMQKARMLSPEMKVVVISGSIGVPETVRAMRMGAYECVAKPFRVNELLDILKRLYVPFSPQPTAQESQSEMIAVSSQMRELNNTLQHIARSRTSTVLIHGETGSGKEVVAQRLHNLSERHDKPFVAVNCSAIPASLIESELFGHEKGAFTDAKATRKGYFEAAGDGTLFLDEIGDLPLDLQTKLLRVLQERSFRRVGGTSEIPLNARIITATHVDLPKAVRSGRFREDLYYRLAVIPLQLYPLRERITDIMPLADRFLRHFAKEMKVDPPPLNDDHRRMLEAHSWPGNVRELKNVMERYVLLNGRLEFVQGTRDLRENAGDPNKVSSAPVDENERNMIYAMLLKKLLASEKIDLPIPPKSVGV